MKKYISVILIILILGVSTLVFGTNDPVGSMDGYQNNADSAWLNKIGSTIYGIILTVGSAIAIIGLIIMGIRFVTSAPSEKAKIKEELIGFTIGVVILFCAIGIIGIFQNIGEQIGNEAGGSSSNSPGIAPFEPKPSH